MVFDPLQSFDPSGKEITETLDGLPFISLYRLNVGKWKEYKGTDHFDPEVLGQIVYPYVILKLKRKRATTH